MAGRSITFDPVTVPDHYAIDPDAPNFDNEDLSIVTVPETCLPLSHQSLERLSVSVNPLDPNLDGHEVYVAAVSGVFQLMQVEDIVA